MALSRDALKLATQALYADLLETAKTMRATGVLKPRDVAALLNATGRYGIGAENTTHHTVTPLLPAAQRHARLQALLGSGDDVTPDASTRSLGTGEAGGA